MTIPPIGNPPVSPIQPDNNRNQDQRAKPAGSDSQNAKIDRSAGERVELSPDAQRIRERQIEITRLQVAERTAKAIVDDAREIRDLESQVREGRRNQDSGRAENAQRQMDERIERLNERKSEARFEGENVLDGREMKFRFDDSEETIRTPDVSREIDAFVRRAREDSRREHSVSERDDLSKTREFIEKAGKMRARLETEVRESIAGAVRESSESRPRDAADAERMINRARESRQESQPRQSTGSDDISGKASDLLK